MISHEYEKARGPILYLLTVLWGKTFREMFLSGCLSSLLAPRNIPIIENKTESRFVIVTTGEDWQAMQDHPIFELLRSYIEPIHIPMRHPQPTDLKMLVMSAGHKAATEYAFNRGAFGVVLCPDIIYSNGTIAALQTHARHGVDVVLAIGMRYEQEGMLEELEKAHLLRPGHPLGISPRDLVAFALEHLHSESKLYEWDSDHYWQTPVTTIWRVPGCRGLVAHSFSWTPMLINYAVLKRHATGVFDDWTMDAHYIYDNFGERARVHVVQDSDELMQVSLTSEKVLTYYPLRRDRRLASPVVGNLVRMTRLRNFVGSRFTDPLRRRIFTLPVRIHAEPITSEWVQVEARARDVVARSLARPSLAESVVASLVAGDDPQRKSVFWYWRYRRFAWQRVKEKVGLVQGHSSMDGKDWVSPAFGLMNPIWSWRRYRRFAWQRVKEKVGLVHGRSRMDDGRDWVSPALGLMNPIWSFRVILLSVLPWCWKYRRVPLAACEREDRARAGPLAVGRWSRLGEPAFGPVTPVWSLQVTLLRLIGAKRSDRASTGRRRRH